MASPSGVSSGSSTRQSIEENLQQNPIDARKRKRTISNRESARRSRMRKQNHLDQLRAQVIHLRTDNNQIATSINLVAHLCSNIEYENSILRAQASELNNRLQALNEIIFCINSNESSSAGFDYGEYDQITGATGDQHEPVMASFPLVSSCAD